MEQMELIWSGAVGNDDWDLYVVGYYDGPVLLPICCQSEDGDETEPGSRVVVWRMLFLSRKGERCKAWWYPLDRELTASLPAWGKVAFGNLKRHLIRLGEFPSSTTSAPMRVVR